MGIGEWETVMTMQQRNPGHYWDRKPLWGYVNEADPAVMSMEIEQATRHGVNVFIFDWYWYDGRPFMETTLDNGFLKAGNVDKMRFLPHVGQPRRTQPLGYAPGARTRAECDLDGKGRPRGVRKNMPAKHRKVFQAPAILQDRRQAGLHGLRPAATDRGTGRRGADGRCPEMVQEGGEESRIPGLELQFAMWSINLNYSGFDGGKTENPENDFIRTLGFTGTTHYQFAHFANVDQDYLTILEQVRDEWARIDTTYDFTYYPHISVGWDNSPHRAQRRGEEQHAGKFCQGAPHGT